MIVLPVEDRWNAFQVVQGHDGTWSSRWQRLPEFQHHPAPITGLELLRFCRWFFGPLRTVKADDRAR